MVPSPRALRYFEAMERERDNFDFGAWLSRERDAQARPKGARPGSLQTETVADMTMPPREATNAARSSTTALCLGRLQIPTRVLSARIKDSPRDARKNSLFEKLSMVTDAWDEFQQSRSRDAVFGYLRRVYSLVIRYKGRRRTNRLLGRTFEFAGIPFDGEADPFTTVIRCTCEQKLDTKAISKMARALRYAAHRNRPPRLLKSFMKAQGGINACADQYAKQLGRGVQLIKKV
jgi:hypothetical protein